MRRAGPKQALMLLQLLLQGETQTAKYDSIQLTFSGFRPVLAARQREPDLACNARAQKLGPGRKPDRVQELRDLCRTTGPAAQPWVGGQRAPPARSRGFL